MKTKKELKNDYKELKPEMGVFQIKNLSNGKILIEGATNMEARWNRHRSELRFNSHRNTALQKDWNTFGESQFTFEVLSPLKYDEEKQLDYQREVKLLEEMYLEELAPYGEKGYH